MHRVSSCTTRPAVSPHPDVATRSSFPSRRKPCGLIGRGWYGKADLFRLIQVAPVGVVSLCDAHRTMLAQAADGDSYQLEHAWKK